MDSTNSDTNGPNMGAANWNLFGSWQKMTRALFRSPRLVRVKFGDGAGSNGKLFEFPFRIVLPCFIWSPYEESMTVSNSGLLPVRIDISFPCCCFPWQQHCFPCLLRVLLASSSSMCTPWMGLSLGLHRHLPLCSYSSCHTYECKEIGRAHV